MFDTAIGREIEQILEKKIPHDRAGFLFGMVVGMLQSQGMSEAEVRAEIGRGLAFIYPEIPNNQKS